jgi:putative ABC transport system permease protein
MGPGAERAAAALDVPHRDVLSRTSWLDARQHLALVAGVGRMMAVSAGAAALFALIALIATVLAGARRRARSLSLLRTLGVRSRMAWWLALSEAAPVVVAALVGGIVAGAGIVLVSGPALGLAVLAGGVGEPVLLVSSAVILGVAAGAVAVLAMAIVAAVAAHRRDRLSEVLRVGETG